MKWIALVVAAFLFGCEERTPEPVPRAASAAKPAVSHAPVMPPRGPALPTVPTSPGPAPAFPPEPARNEVQGDAAVTFAFAPPLDQAFDVESVRKKRKVFGGVARGEEIVRTVSKVIVTRDGEGFRWKETPVSFSAHGERSSRVDELVAGSPISLRLDAAGTLVSVEGYDDISARAPALLSPDDRKMVASTLDPAMLRRTREQEWRGRVGDLLGRRAELGKSIATESELPLPRGSTQLYGVVEVGPWTDCALGKCVVVETRQHTDVDTLARATGADPKAWHDDHADAGAGVGPDGHRHAPKVNMNLAVHSLRILDPKTSMPVWERSERLIDLGTGTLSEELVVAYRYPTP